MTSFRTTKTLKFILTLELEVESEMSDDKILQAVCDDMGIAFETAIRVDDRYAYVNGYGLAPLKD